MIAMTLAVSLALAQAPARPPQTDETVAVQRGARLTVDDFAGEVVVHAWDRDAVRVQARHRARTKVNVQTVASGVSVTADSSMGPASVDYDISAPAWMPVKITGTYEFATVDGIQAEVSVETVRGDVTVKGSRGALFVRSVEGRVSVENASGRLDVSSVNEGVRMSGTSGEIVAESINGPVTLSGMRASSATVSTVNGDITYNGTLVASGRYEFTSHNGDLLLTLPDGTNATFTVRTYNGELMTDVPVQGSRGGLERGRAVTLTLGSGAADVSLESFDGEIRIRRARAGGTDRN
ncbi:MAG TPA: DUF4097 family beta strand repeat-containing protein [Vicinamibacterales bacterium]|nr:DUF4097 family beta strand repeat-containing protein [Vicinamibacterales bacterium]